jgi:hypothetical protein
MKASGPRSIRIATRGGTNGTKNVRKFFTSVPIDDETANAINARSMEDISDAFSCLECQDRMVKKVLVGPVAYGDMMSTNHHDLNPDGTINLFGATVELANDGLLVIWDEEEINSSKRKRMKKTKTLRDDMDMKTFNVGKVIVSG